jgi:hypothetical protein
MTGVRVQGLDLSMTATGVAWPDGTTTTVKPRGDGDYRLLKITQTVMIRCDLVVIEDMVTRSPAASIVGMVHGAVRLQLLNAGLPYTTVPPATLKKFATGRGTASKADMAVALFKRAGLELDDDNQVDAWWLRAIGHQLLGDPLIPMPAAQVTALAKVSLVDPPP